MNATLDVLPERTVCACEECRSACREKPGMLIPADIETLRDAFGLLTEDDWIEWAENSLLASPGALVMHDGVMFRIPTLVPRKNSQGCVFLSWDGLCQIHNVSPYGCRVFDYHQDADEGTRRLTIGLKTIIADFANVGLYAQTWQHLFNAGKRSPGPRFK